MAYEGEWSCPVALTPALAAIPTAAAVKSSFTEFRRPGPTNSYANPGADIPCPGLPRSPLPRTLIDMVRAIHFNASAAMTLGLMIACGGTTTGSTGSGGSSSSGGAFGTGGASGTGGVGGSPGCRTRSDCIYPLLCLRCPDGTNSCPTGANCVNGQCITTYNHECGPGSGGSTGSGGSGGASTGGTGGVSPGTVLIEFMVGGPTSYCHQGCASGPSITIQDSAGTDLALGDVCRTECSTCALSLCPPVACYPDGVVTGAQLNWNGSYFATSTCGSGTSCLKPASAVPGKYMATFCATPGTMTGPDGGYQQCITSGPAKCGTVTFDFPSSTVVKGTVGP